MDGKRTSIPVELRQEITLLRITWLKESVHMAMLKSFNQQAKHRYKLQTGTSKENMLEFKRITSVSIL